MDKNDNETPVLDNKTSTTTIPSEASTEADLILKLKKENDSLKAANADLNQAKTNYYDKLLNGTNTPANESDLKPSKEQIESRKATLRNRLFNAAEDVSNLEYISSALELRQLILDETDGNEDIFCPSGKRFTPSSTDLDDAANVAAGLQQLVDDSNGSPEAFVALYNSRVIDTGMPPMHKGARKLN